MKKNILVLLFNLSLTNALYAEDMMVERMQSVVDEVSELRLRYEACTKELVEKDTMIENFSKKGFDSQSYREKSIRIQELEFENQKLKEAKNKEESKLIKKLENDLKAVEKENQRLMTSAEILVEKNHSLITQMAKVKELAKEDEGGDRTLSDLKKELEKVKTALDVSQKENEKFKDENKALQEKIKSSQVNIEAYELELQQHSKVLKKYAQIEEEFEASKNQQNKQAELKTICPDDNPFPKLMMKDETNLLPPEHKSLPSVEKGPSLLKKTSSERVVSKTGTAYRMKCESNVYDDPENGKPVSIWEEKTSFTSNVSQGEWVKATGIFVDKKWQKAKEAYWIRKEDTIKR